MIVQELIEPEQAPPQTENDESFAGVAVNVIELPELTEEGQVIPPHVIMPEPEPNIVVFIL
jgi:hypothetical protein